MTIHIYWMTCWDIKWYHIYIYMCVSYTICHADMANDQRIFGGAATETEGRGQESGAGRGDGEAWELSGASGQGRGEIRQQNLYYIHMTLGWIGKNVDKEDLVDQTNSLRVALVNKKSTIPRSSDRSVWDSGEWFEGTPTAISIAQSSKWL